MINLFAERPFIDMWSLTHLIFGVILFFVLYPKKFKLEYSVFIILLVTIFWEIFEIRVKVDEVMTNRITDILVTFVGFFVIYKINKKSKIFENPDERDIFFRYFILFFILISTLGWMSFMFL